jgi:hypothetical protein
VARRLETRRLRSYRRPGSRRGRARASWDKGEVVTTQRSRPRRLLGDGGHPRLAVRLGRIALPPAREGIKHRQGGLRAALCRCRPPGALRWRRVRSPELAATAMALRLRRFRLRRSSPLDEVIADLAARTEACQRTRADLERQRVVIQRVSAMQATLRGRIQASTRRSMWHRAMKGKRCKPLPA